MNKFHRLLGTDSAPHAVGSKESECGCAGVFTAHAAIELYAEAFDRVGAMDKLQIDLYRAHFILCNTFYIFFMAVL